jgi:putative N6-adenine-specific DNA methylase
MNKLQMLAPCHFGLEKTLAFEIRRAGGEDLEITDGRIMFAGSPEVLVRANLTCAVAERIGVVLVRFKAQTFDDVFDKVKEISVADLLEPNAAFPVTKGQSLNSKLTSIPALQRTVKKALAEAMSRCHNSSTLPETGVSYPVRFFLHKDEMTVFLDSSGAGLHKRGYRANSGVAPIKETLAAGIVDVAKVRDCDCVIDPFCGSGTILIESALKALRIPPGLNRHFVAERWGFVPLSLWKEQRNLLRAAIPGDAEDVAFRAIGYDIDPECVKLTLANAEKAGVARYVHAEVRDIRDWQAPVDAAKAKQEQPHRAGSARPEGCLATTKVITNPPYAERMLEKPDTARIYRVMGRRLKNQESYIITSDPEFEEFFGRKADKNRKLYNGMLMCRLHMYR